MQKIYRKKQKLCLTINQNLSVFKKIYSRKCLPVIVDSFSFSLKRWEWISIPLVDVVFRSFSPFSFLTRVVLPARAHPITIPLPLYTEIFPFFILFTNVFLSFSFQYKISCGILSIKKKKIFISEEPRKKIHCLVKR